LQWLKRVVVSCR